MSDIDETPMTKEQREDFYKTIYGYDIYETKNFVLDSVPKDERPGKNFSFGSLYGGFGGEKWTKPASDEPLVEIKMVGGGGGGNNTGTGGVGGTGGQPGGGAGGGAGGQPGGGAGGGGGGTGGQPVTGSGGTGPAISRGMIVEDAYRQEMERSLREQIERDVRAEFNIGIEQPKKKASHKAVANPKKRKMNFD